MMIGFGLGGVLMGRLSDRFGLFRPLLGASLAIGAGFVLAALSNTILGFALAHGVLIGLVGCAVTFAPLMADTALWFARRRGIAVAVCASGNYLAGAVWPPVMEHFIATEGWRATYIGVGLFCTCSMGLLALLMRQAPPNTAAATGPSSVDNQRERPFDLSPNTATAALCVAGLSCCVAMAMPQVHIVAYCTDLGFGAARGAQMLSIMLACGIVSRLVSGALSDRIGGIRTLVLVNGAAVISLLTFVGQVWANDQRNGSAMAHILFWPLLLFLTGLVLAVATTLLAYVTQMITAESGVAVIPPAAKRLRKAAIACSILSLVAFTTAAILTALGIAG